VAAEKISITVDRELLENIRDMAGANLSQWFSTAAEERLQRERLRAWVAEEVADHGPIPEDIREEVHRQWPRTSQD
jgi:post-segregation antitoxin (ccd killing protein)